MTNKYLEKIADFSEHGRDIANAGIVAGLGGVASHAANAFMAKRKIPHVGAKAFAIGAGAGLVADYAGLKIGKAIDRKFQKEASDLTPGEKQNVNAAALTGGMAGIYAGHKSVDIQYPTKFKASREVVFRGQKFTLPKGEIRMNKKTFLTPGEVSHVKGIRGIVGAAVGSIGGGMLANHLYQRAKANHEKTASEGKSSAAGAVAGTALGAGIGLHSVNTQYPNKVSVVPRSSRAYRETVHVGKAGYLSVKDMKRARAMGAGKGGILGAVAGGLAGYGASKLVSE